MKLMQRRLSQIEIMTKYRPEEIAEIMEVSRATYFNFKNGSATPDMNHLKRLIDRFGYNPEWFFNVSIE